MNRYRIIFESKKSFSDQEILEMANRVMKYAEEFEGIFKVVEAINLEGIKQDKREDEV